MTPEGMPVLVERRRLMLSALALVSVPVLLCACQHTAGRTGDESEDEDTPRVTTPGGGTGGNCFAADTAILMADGGTKPIAEIALGEMVLSYDFARDLRVASEVTRLFAARAEGVLRLNGISVTNAHPFAVGEDEWRAAGLLRTGDALLGDGPTEVRSIEEIAGATDVFNLIVAGTHNYYVTDNRSAFLVHNKSGGD